MNEADSRTKHLRTLAIYIISHGCRQRRGEGMGWGLDEKYPFGNYDYESVGIDILRIIGIGNLNFFEDLSAEDQEKYLKYAHEIYDGVEFYIRGVLVKEIQS